MVRTNKSNIVNINDDAHQTITSNPQLSCNAEHETPTAKNVLNTEETQDHRKLPNESSPLSVPFLVWLPELP